MAKPIYLAQGAHKGPHRKKIFLWHSFQSRYVFFLAGALMVLLLFSGLHGLFMVQQYLPVDLVGNASVDIKMATYRLLAFGAVYIGIVVFFSVFLSHRSFGPLSRLEADIQRLLEESNQPLVLKVREGDDMEGVVTALNTLFKKRMKQ